MPIARSISYALTTPPHCASIVTAMVMASEHPPVMGKKMSKRSGGIKRLHIVPTGSTAGAGYLAIRS